MKLSSSNIKKFLQKKAFLIFYETETLKNLFLFQEIELSELNKNNKKETKQKKKKTWEMELSSPGLKKFLIFLEELPKPQKPKFIILLQKSNAIIFLKNTFK